MGSQKRGRFNARLAPVSAGPAAESVQVKPAIDGVAPLRSAFRVIYCTIAILVFALPGSLTDWLNDLPPNAFVETCKSAVDAIEKASQKIGLVQLYQDARGTFIKLLPRRH
jgi:hypothetical protein